MAFTHRALKAELALGTILALAASNLAPAQNPAPVRMARVSYITGKVSWRPDGTTGWSRVALNLPLRQGAEVWLAQNSRLELQFDDGSSLRLGDGAVATFQTLYSDSQGEFTEVKLSAGTSSWHLKDKYSIYQIDAPCDSVKSVGPSDFRVDIKPTADALAVRRGSATISAGGRDTPILAGHYTVRHSPDDAVQVRSLGAEDPWDHFNDNRNAILAEEPAHVPTDIAIVSGGLDRHGRWHDVPGEGWVWSPTVEVGWRPYHRGHWAWVDPYGWTWVSSDPWGWAPYHYGTWAHFDFGWGWCPGPAVQYWSPARVDFVESNGYVTWAPLAPQEVVYPAFSVGFGSGNWWLNFSIGGAAVYEPYAPGICQPVAYPYGYSDPGWRRHGWQPGGWGQANYASNPYNFVPRNAAFGAVGVNTRGFGGNVAFTAINRNASGSFRTGRQAVAFRQAFSGPVGIRPNQTAFTPGHAFTTNARPMALNRALVRGRVSPNIARTSGSFGPARTFGSRPNGVAMRSGSFAPNVSRAPANVAAMRSRSFTPNVARAPANVAAARGSMGFRGRTGSVSPRIMSSGRAAGTIAGRTRGFQTTNRPNNGQTSVAARGRNQPIATRTRGFQTTNRPINRQTAVATRGRTQSFGRTQRAAGSGPPARTVRRSSPPNSGGPSVSRQFNGGNRVPAPMNRGGGYQSARPSNRGGGNQGFAPINRGSAYQGARPSNRGGGNEGFAPINRGGAYQGARPSNRGGGNQGFAPINRGSGYQGARGGGSQSSGPINRGGGYQGARPGSPGAAPVNRGGAPPRGGGPSNRGGPNDRKRGGG